MGKNPKIQASVSQCFRVVDFISGLSQLREKLVCLENVYCFVSLIFPIMISIELQILVKYSGKVSQAQSNRAKAIFNVFI